MNKQMRNAFYEQCKEIYGKENAYVSSLIINDIYDFFHYYKEFRLLFVEHEERNYHDLAYNIAPSFFQQVYRSLLWMLTVDFCNLVESVESQGNKNLTVEWLIRFVPDETKQEELLKKIGELKQEGSIWHKIKKKRNKMISHRDYDVALGNVKLPEVLLSEIDKGFVQLAELVGQTGFSIISEDTDLNNWGVDNITQKRDICHTLYSGGVEHLMECLKIGYDVQNNQNLYFEYHKQNDIL